ncbi:SMP-30/gluconolactonase/LRE family protein [Rugosimonospora africana]|uniref:SMP-30/Gluconolactonase/LRE-like region domain-containing protein n=1 Tax=Rugosimonospora africana TaxID=556532 RepID=A0A8J3VS78_9ACTN|nr:SMP-30/gluconolactonase/LRE family protein [Rugosimonospora africana]GIH16168.1 hypothetical protein Raf01_43400 [Rugosimonospora africana]
MRTLDESDVLVPAAGELCEGPCWDTRTGRLYFVDILAGRVHAVDPVGGARRTWELGVPVGAVAPRRAGGWIAAVERGFAAYDDDWRPAGPVVAAPAQRDGTRFNDGGCDPAGRFWAGTLAYDGTPGTGALYRLDAAGTVTEMLSGVTNSNGLAWSAPGIEMFYVDTGKATIDRMAFDPTDGTIADRRTLVAFPSQDGSPDGMAIDRDGFLWVALWGGGRVRRYSPGGVLDGELRLPVSQVTSVAFGGADFGDLFITTAAEGLAADQRARQPLAGSVFRYRPGVAGLPPATFAG